MVASPPPTSPSKVATWTAIILILVYLVMIGVLVAMRDDKNWDRLVYLLTGFEAIVFAGAGVLFGTTVQRAHVADARQDAQAARDEAGQAQQRAEQAQGQAAAGRGLSAAVIARAEAERSEARRGARPDEEEPPGPLDDLAAMARAMMPPEQ